MRTALATLAALALPTTAQLELSFQGGVLGAGLNYHIAGDAPQLYVLMVSLSTGPTPLSLFDPADPRQLDVGLELSSIARLGFLPGPSFEAVEHYAPPAAPGLQGLPFYAQAVSLPGTPFLVDELTERTSFVFSFPDTTHEPVGQQGSARRFASATSLDDGRVLLAGGRGPVGAPLASFEWFDEQTQTFSVGGSLGVARSHHTAHLLDDGSVLLVGGLGAGGALANAERVLPDGSTTGAGSLLGARVHHSSVLLGDGSVLVLGGASAANPSGGLGLPSSDDNPGPAAIERYDPLSGLWSSVGVLPQPRFGVAAARLVDGRVLIAGGANFGAGSEASVADCFVYDPQDDSLLPTAPLPDPRAFGAITPTESGRVLLVGGARLFPQTSTITGTATSLIYDLAPGAAPNTGTWTHGPTTSQIIVDGEVECLPRGGLFGVPGGPIPLPPLYFAGGGWEDVDYTGAVTPNASLLECNAALTAWSSPDDLLQPRLGVALAPLELGARVLIVGAPQGAPGDKSAELHITAP